MLHQVGLSLLNYQDDAQSNKHKAIDLISSSVVNFLQFLALVFG